MNINTKKKREGDDDVHKAEEEANEAVIFYRSPTFSQKSGKPYEGPLRSKGPWCWKGQNTWLINEMHVVNFLLIIFKAPGRIEIQSNIHAPVFVRSFMQSG